MATSAFSSLNATHPAVMGTVMALEDAFVALYAANRAWRAAGHEIASVGEQVGGQTRLAELLPALRQCGDAYPQFVLAHQPPDGSITEQINGDTGQPQGAPDLTWAVSELLNTLAMRA